MGQVGDVAIQTFRSVSSGDGTGGSSTAFLCGLELRERVEGSLLVSLGCVSQTMGQTWDC